MFIFKYFFFNLNPTSNEFYSATFRSNGNLIIQSDDIHIYHGLSINYDSSTIKLVSYKNNIKVLRLNCRSLESKRSKLKKKKTENNWKKQISALRKLGSMGQTTSFSGLFIVQKMLFLNC